MSHLGVQPMEEGTELRNQQQRLRQDQVQNDASGFSYAVDDKKRLLRFLMLGTENGTYYQMEHDLHRDSVQCIDRMIINGQGPEVVKTIKDVSVQGRACKQNSTIYALAVCARSNDPDTKKAAYSVLSDVCRIPTDLFYFIDCCEKESAGTGWGRAHRRSVGNWYNNYSEVPLKLAMHVTKYRKRNDWEHRDVLRLAHMKPKTPEIACVVMYIIKGLPAIKAAPLPKEENKNDNVLKIIKYLEAVDSALHCEEDYQMVELIKEHNLVREHVPTQLLKSVPVWKALLEKMPVYAMVRNLGKMGSMEMLAPDSEEETIIIHRLTDKSGLEGSRIHPFKLLVAINTYKSGSGNKGKLLWPKNQKIIDSLEQAFYLCFNNVLPTGKKFLLAVDVSGSMNTPILGASSVTARDGAAAMMMVTAKTEKSCDIVAFSNGLQELNIKPNDTLNKVLDRCSSLPFSGTDCSAPMFYAMERKKLVDVFVVYTDSETYFGNIHPSQAIEQYRKWSGISDARLIVVGMASNGFSIADPKDPFMMDVVGFDTGAPEAMRSFVIDYDLTETKGLMNDRQ